MVIDKIDTNRYDTILIGDIDDIDYIDKHGPYFPQPSLLGPSASFLFLTSFLEMKV